MAKNSDIDYFESAIKYDHLGSSVAPGSYNPGMRLLFASNDRKLANQLVFLHEFQHATLSASLTGAVTSFFHWLAIDCLVFWAVHDASADFEPYWQLASTCRQNARSIHASWTLLHEGAATFHDWRYLEQDEDDDRLELRQALTRLLADAQTPYAQGFKLIQDWYTRFPFINNIRMVIQQLANVDLLESVPGLLGQSNQSYEWISAPDRVLEHLVHGVLQAPAAPRSFDATVPQNAREFIYRYAGHEARVFNYESGQVDVLEVLLAAAAASSLLPPNYRERIGLLQLAHVRYEVGAMSSWLYFPAVRTRIAGRIKTTIVRGSITARLGAAARITVDRILDEIEFLCDADDAIRRHLPSERVSFQHYLTSRDAPMVTRSYYYSLFGQLFPATTDKLWREAGRMSQG